MFISLDQHMCYVLCNNMYGFERHSISCHVMWCDVMSSHMWCDSYVRYSRWECSLGYSYSRWSCPHIQCSRNISLCNCWAKYTNNTSQLKNTNTSLTSSNNYIATTTSHVMEHVPSAHVQGLSQHHLQSVMYHVSCIMYHVWYMIPSPCSVSVPFSPSHSFRLDATVTDSCL